MTKLEKYRKQHAEVVDQMKAILADADESSEDGRLTEEQQAEYDALDARRLALLESIRQREEIEKADLEAAALQVVGPTGKVEVGKNRVEEDPRRGFTTHRDFLLAVMENSGLRDRGLVSDERLQPLAVADREDRQAAGEIAYLMPRGFNPTFLAAAGSDEQGGYDDTVGGFLVRRGLLATLLQVGMEGDPTAGRTAAIPMEAPTVDIPARVDKNHQTSVSGGFTVTRKPETVAATASRALFEMVTLKATSLFGLAYATEEILTDSAISFIAFIEAGFRDQFAHHILSEKLRGGGANEYQGVIGAGATVAITRANANEIAAADIINMRARAWGYGSMIWLANHDTYPQLAQAAIVVEGAVGGGIVTVFQPSLQEDRPDMLLGRPIFFSEYPSALGAAGDLILGNWSQYLDGLYQPLRSAESMHVRFVNHERTFKFWLRNAGAPWWRTALTPHKGASKLSPFVIIAA